MLYLIRLFILFSLCVNVYAKDNPLSVILNIRNNNVEGEMTQHFVLKIRSVSHDPARFLVKIQIPKSHIEVVEGKDYYRGILKGLEEKEFFLVIRGVKEGEGEVFVRVFSLIDELKIDNENSRLFSAKFKIANDMMVTLSDAIEKDTNAVPKQPVEIVTNAIEIKPDPNVMTEDKKASQHIVIEGTFRHNKIYRNLMVLISFLILGYLYMRIKKHS